MIRLVVIAVLCLSFALAGCVVPPPHHDDGPGYDHPRGHDAPPQAHPYWDRRWR